MAITDMTEEELRKFAEALANATSTLDKKTAEERAAAEKYDARMKKLGDVISASADAFVTFNKEAYKGSSVSKGSAAATEKLGDAAQAAAVGLALLMPGGVVIKGILAGIALLTKKLFDLSAEIDNQTGEIYKAYQEMAQVGASGAAGMQEVFDGLQKVGLGTEKFAAYTKLISDSANDLATFGGTLNKGRKIFENTMASLSDGQREQLEYMGLDREAQANATMAYIKQQRLLTQGTKAQMDTSSTAVMKYIDETDKLARITGLNRKEQEKLLDDAMRNEAFNATIQDIQEKHGPEAVRRVLEAQAMAAKAGPETRKQFEAALSGFVGSTNEAQQAFMSSGGKMFELTEQLRDGQIKNTRDTATSMNQVFLAQGEVAKQFRAQAQMMNFGKSGMGNFYEQVKAGTISLDDLTNAYDEADAETKKRDAQTQKLAKAENDYRENGLNLQAKLQLRMGKSIDDSAIAAKKMREASEYALKMARALAAGQKVTGVPETGPVPTTQEAKDTRVKAEDDLKAATADREKLEKDKGRADEETKKARIAEQMARREAEIQRAREATAQAQAARQGGVSGVRPTPPAAAPAAAPTGSKVVTGKIGAPTTTPAPAGAAAPPAANPATGAAAPAKSYSPEMGNYLKKIAQVESTGNKNAEVEQRDPKTGKRLSNAAGLFQFIPSTWQDTTKAMGKNYPLSDRFDPEKAAEVAAFFTEQNKKQLVEGVNPGRGKPRIEGMGADYKPTDADTYMAHFLGAGGALTFLKAMQTNPEMPAADAVGEAQAKSNPNIFYVGFRNFNETPVKTLPKRTLAEVYGMMSKKLDRGAQEIAQGRTTEDVLQLAEGGIVPAKPGGTRAVIGEAGVSEAVIPLKSGAVPVHINSKDIDSLGGGYNELKGYTMGAISTDLSVLEKIAGKLGAYDKSTEMITDPKLWKEIVQSGMLMNYDLGPTKVGTRGMSEMVGAETVADALAGRIKELIDTKKDSGEAIAQTRTEFADMMKTFYEDFFAKMQAQMAKENPLDSEMLAVLKDISKTNAAAAGSSEKMLRYTQN